MIWQIFLANRKKNSLVAGGMLFFNTLAALMEGASFALLLSSLVFLSGEMLPYKWFRYVPQTLPNPFLLSLLGAVFLQILRSVASYLGQIMTTMLTLNTQHEAQKQIFSRIFRMSFREVSQFKKGDLMHHAISPPSFIPLLFDEYNRLVISSLMICVYLVMMAVISTPLTFFNLAFFGIAALLQRYFFSKIVRASQQHTNHVTDLSKQTSQSLEGMKAVHLFQRQRYTLNRIDQILHSISKATLAMKKWNALIPCLNESLGITVVGISLILGTFLLPQKSPAHAAQLLVYLTLIYRLGVRLQIIMSAKGVIASYSGQVERLSEILTVSVDPPEEENTSTPSFEKKICFENVSFLYPRKNSYALKNISLQIPKKKIVALVGVSGAGKSSLIDLLLRLYSPTQGTITLDGNPIESLPRSSWRNLFGVVPQDAFLFNETIEENIRFGNLHASHADIIEAATLAGADPFIQNLPEKYQTLLGEKGYRLSGGEKQRISLAQALVRNPEILVLDEATSHLDSRSEQIVQEALLRLRSHKTMLIVAHRLSTIQMADLIYVMENGRIIESGTHQDLIRLSGRYQMFWQLQTTSLSLN